VRSREHPLNATRNQPGAHTWKAKMSRARGAAADPWVSPPVLCFLQVAVRWVLKAVSGAHVDWRRFGRVGGP
jgi:hypothetical protein